MSLSFDEIIRQMKERKVRCTCGVEVIGASVCEECYRVATKRERAELLRDAYESVPRGEDGRTWARFDDAALRDRVRPARAIDAVRGEASKASRFVLSGYAGSGKTSLAVAMLLAVIDAGRDIDASAQIVGRAAGARFVSAFALAKARATSALGSEPADLRSALRAPFLVLDDLGQEPDMSSSSVAEVIYERHLHGLRTVVTTGFDAQSIDRRYGDGIGRRVFEGAVHIPLGGS